MNEEIDISLLINYWKPCKKLTNECLHDIHASCPLCDPPKPHQVMK